MALSGIYSAGTISVANGGTTVTGVGTSFVAALIRAGDIVCKADLSDMAVITANPTSPTSLTIEPWPGATLAAGSNYKIIRLSDAGRLSDVMMQFASGLQANVAALGGLALAADKGIYATGAGTLATFDAKAGFRALGAAASLVKAADLLHIAGANIAAAATLNLDAATGDLIDVTGNTGITAVTLAAGAERLCRFTGTPTITAGASLILSNGTGSGVNRTCKSGDYILFRGYSGGVVRGVILPKAGTVDRGGDTMAGQLNLPSIMSGRVSIADDAVADLGNICPSVVGLLLVWAENYITPIISGGYLTRTGAPSPILIPAFGPTTNISLVTTDVTGTTGTDGNLTLSATLGHFKIENRTGQTRPFGYLVMGGL